MWRFHNFNKINPDKKIDLGFELEPRVKQIVNSFISLFSKDNKQLEEFKIFIKNYQEDLIDERRNSFSGSIISSIHDLLEKGKINISMQDIIEEGCLTNFKGEKLKPRGLSSTLKSLGFKKTIMQKVDGKVKRCVPLNPKMLVSLFKRYGNGVTVVTILWGIGKNKKEKQKELNHVVDPASATIVTTVTPLPQDKEKLVRFDPQLKQYFQCSISDCYDYEINRDGKNKAYCKDHWDSHAEK